MGPPAQDVINSDAAGADGLGKAMSCPQPDR
jgi:hypothetical protein